MQFLAKSEPEETIEEHTKNAIEKYNEFKNIYFGIYELDWELLEKAVFYHDTGKANDKFQIKMKTKNRIRNDEEIPHGYLSAVLIDYDNVFDNIYDDSRFENYMEIRKKILASAVYFHHNREELSGSCEEIEKQLESELQNIDEAKINLIEIFKNKVKKTKKISDIFQFTIPTQNENEYYLYCKIKGLLNKIDYAASSYESPEIKNDFLNKLLDRILENFREKDENARWNDLQQFMEKNKNNNVIAIAQTGMGKTEAGLLWIGDNKGFFTLPLRTAINSIYKRVVDNIENKEKIISQVGLLHSDTSLKYLELDFDNYKDKDYFEKYLHRTRYLSLPLTICTIDQIFPFVYKFKGCEMDMATLSYSKVVIDEIQMYSPQLLATILVAIHTIVKLGGKFSIMTATMPSFFIEEMRKLDIPFTMVEPFIDDRVRHSIKVMEKNIDESFILQKYKKNKIIVICNTVRTAQHLYNRLKNNVDNLYMFHSRYIKKDRNDIEKQILEFGSNDSTETGIWICTQVVEASLDIDFDLLITEFSDINGLFQRMGRCYRKRSLNEGRYNCFVFVGDRYNVPSGVNKIIDGEIFDKGKEIILKYDGILSEKDKQNIINEVYSVDNIKKTSYFRSFQNYKRDLLGISVGTYDEKSAKNIFRDISQQKEIIPKSVYDENRDEIDELIERYKNIKDKKEKISIKEKISSYMISINVAAFIANQEFIIKEIEISQYMKIIVLDVDYDKKIGLESKNLWNKNKSMSIEDRIF